jgi:hypothetical protein
LEELILASVARLEFSFPSSENPMNIGGWTAALAKAPTIKATQPYHIEDLI